MFKKLTRSALLLIISGAFLFVLSGQAKASVQNADVNPPQPIAGADAAPVNCQTQDFTGAIWGVGATITARIYDLDGSVRYAKSYTFKLSSTEVGTTNGSGGIGVNYNPNDGTGNRYSNILASVNDLNRKTCEYPYNPIFNPDGPTTTYPYVIDSNYSNATGLATGTAGSDGVSLDCWYGGSGTSRNQFTFSGQSIDDPSVAGKKGYWSYYATDKNGNQIGGTSNGVTIVDSDSGDGVDLNDQSFTIHLDFHVLPPDNGTLSTQKYAPADHQYGVDTPPTIPDAVKKATVHYSNSGGWETSGNENPFVRNLWVNPFDPNSYTSGPYTAKVDVPPGYKVKRWEIWSPSAKSPYATRAVHEESQNTITGIAMTSSDTVYLDFFFEQKTESNVDAINCPANGFMTGWVQIPDGKGGVGPNDVHLYIDKKATPGVNPDVIIPKSDLKQTGEKFGDQPIFRFTYRFPQQYYDGKTHSVRAYSFNQDGTPFELNSNPRPQTFTCPGSTGNITDCPKGSDTQDFIAGWGFDGQDEAKRPSFAVYVKNSQGKQELASTIGADQPSQAARDYLNNHKYPGPFEPGNIYGFNKKLVDVIPEKFFDGQNHTIYVYVLTKDGSNPQIGTNVDIGNSPCPPIPLQQHLHPWLQTFNGDVIASGKVIDQKAGDLGARPAGSTDKDSEYLIISEAGGGSPFCSTSQYLLTNTAATTGNCDNGSGYSLNRYGLGPSTEDNVIKAINKAWVTNGSGNSGGGANTKCNPYNTLAVNNIDGLTLNKGFGKDSCLNGTIVKLNNGAIGDLTVESGRITIWVDGDLSINKNIIYDYSPGYDDPRKLPNLAIVVRGNVLISGSVGQIDAAIYSTGQINTCRDFNGNTGAAETACNQQLIVHGLLTGRDGFRFNRVFDNNGTNPPPAEQILLTGQTVAYPPPGLDNLYFGTFDNATTIDSGELQPRF